MDGSPETSVTQTQQSVLAVATSCPNGSCCGWGQPSSARLRRLEGLYERLCENVQDLLDRQVRLEQDYLACIDSDNESDLQMEEFKPLLDESEWQEDSHI